MKGHPITYSAAEMAWLSENRGLVISDYAARFNAIFGRDVSVANLHAMRKRKGWRTGRTGCFEKGMVPHNAGKPCLPGTGGRHPNARRTQFAAGSMNGEAARRYQPIGTERVNEDGYLERKMHDGKPARSRWQSVQRMNWEAVNGPVPAGFALKCLDGDKLNTDPANWEAVHRGVVARLNGGRHKKRIAFDTAPSELKPTLMAVAKLEQAVGDRHREASRRRSPTAFAPAFSTFDMLKAVRGFIERGWTQKAEARDETGRPRPPHSCVATCWCIAGAAVAAGYTAAPVARMLGFKLVHRMVAWNDEPGRTQAEVLLRLDTAIAEGGGE